MLGRHPLECTCDLAIDTVDRQLGLVGACGVDRDLDQADQPVQKALFERDALDPIERNAEPFVGDDALGDAEFTVGDHEGEPPPTGEADREQHNASARNDHDDGGEWKTAEKDEKHHELGDSDTAQCGERKEGDRPTRLPLWRRKPVEVARHASSVPSTIASERSTTRVLSRSASANDRPVICRSGPAVLTCIVARPSTRCSGPRSILAC